MKHQYVARYKNIVIRPLEKKDIEQLRIWRNDKSKTVYLKKIGEITPQMQQNWFESYLENTTEIIFAIEETEKLKRMVGSVAIYDFEDSIAEVGKIQVGDREASGQGIGRIGMTMAMYIGFKKLNIKKFIASVHRDNIAAYKSDMKIGFNVIGNHLFPEGGVEDELEIEWEQFRRINDYVDQIELQEM